MKIFIDSEFKCHADNPDGIYRETNSEFFAGKCQTFVEGYRYVLSGESWTREDGMEFRGEMISPWKDYNVLAAAQAQYEADQAVLLAAYQEGVNSV